MGRGKVDMGNPIVSGSGFGHSGPRARSWPERVEGDYLVTYVAYDDVIDHEIERKWRWDAVKKKLVGRQIVDMSMGGDGDVTISLDDGASFVVLGADEYPGTSLKIRGISLSMNEK